MMLTSRIEDPYKLNAVEWHADVDVSAFQVNVRPWRMLKLHRPTKRHAYRVREVWCRMGADARPYVREGAKTMDHQPPVPDLHKRAILDQMKFTFTFEDQHVTA